MSSEFAIHAENLSKTYHIYKRPEDRLKQMLSLGRRKYFEEYWALRGASLSIKPGQAVGIVGRNGAGKSTLLQMICGTLSPTTGSIQVSGRVAALLELGAGFNPEFTGRENVFLAASILGLTRAEIEERFPAIEQFAAIGDFLDQPVKIYSSGMYARLAFAVVSHVDADVLIVDEILAVGDAIFIQKCMRYIHEFKKKRTLLLVSHDMGAITSLCDQVIWLDRGEVRAVGSPKDICHDYLAASYSELNPDVGFHIGGSRRSIEAPAITKGFDVRQEVLDEIELSNAVEVIEFDPHAPQFGVGGAQITRAILENVEGEPLHLLHGGEEVMLKIDGVADVAMAQPIVGWIVKDRLGQPLFGDNTFLSYQHAPVPIASGQKFEAVFRFHVPYMPNGEYSLSVTIADGTQSDHVMHQWISDAIILKVASSHVVKGLVGIPMLEIALSVSGADALAVAQPS